MRYFQLTYIVIAFLSFSTVISAQENDKNVTFVGLEEISTHISENDYINFIRTSLFDQPEFKYAVSLSAEQEFNLKYARRGRFGTISGNVINDESFERNIQDTQSVRKRRDDSFDASVEIRQPIYSGGKINADIRAAKSRALNSSKQKQQTVSSLIREANEIYINAVSDDFLYNYSTNLLDILRPFKEKVDDRIQSGIMDPIDAAIFSVRYSRIETLVYQLKSAAEVSRNNFSFFFKKSTVNPAFPKMEINQSYIKIEKKSYEVDYAELEYEEKREGIKLARSEYLPKFGISARYTRYDIDDDSNEDDIRGGLYLSVPLFSFGRGIAQINSARAAAQASKNSINIAEKEDNITESSIKSEFENSIINKPYFLQAFKDTLNQRQTIEYRLELSGFAANALAEVILNEITQLKTLLDNEKVQLAGYLALLHQNQQLNNIFRIDLK